MKGFLLGLLVASAAFAGYWVWKSRGASERPVKMAAADAGAPTAKKKTRRARGATRMARVRAGETGGTHAGKSASAGEPYAAPGAAPGAGMAFEPVAAEPEPEPIRLTASDLKVVAQGDDLSRPDVLKLDMSDDKELSELSQDDIDATFRAEETAILDCISKSRPDPEAYVPGRVTVKFRIQRAGTVRGVRVEAPSILQRGGLFGCIGGVVRRLRFPSSGSSQIVTYPFSLS